MNTHKYYMPGMYVITCVSLKFARDGYLITFLSFFPQYNHFAHFY